MDPTRYYTRAEYRAWQAACADHHNARHALQRQELEQERRKNAVHYLTDVEYDEQGLVIFNARQKQALEEASQDLLKEREREEWLASTPDVVDIFERNPCTFLKTLAHFLGKGCYEMDFEAFWQVTPNQCSIQLHKRPEVQNKKSVH
jgi:hypothetical protein